MNQNHPIRQILKEASLGHLPTRGQLDQALGERPDLPDSVNLARFRRAVSVAAEEVATIARPSPNVSEHHKARQRADEHIAFFASTMNDDELAAGFPDDDGIDYDALAANV